MNNNIVKALMGCWSISYRVIMIKLQRKPFNIDKVQLYAPTQDYNYHDIEVFSGDVKIAIESLLKNDRQLMKALKKNMA